MRNLWARIRRYGPILAVFFAMWVVMNEGFTWIIAVAGVVVAVVALLASNAVLGIDFATVFLSPWAMTRYLLVLLRYILEAAWAMAVAIVTGKSVVSEFGFESELSDETLLFVFATSITLTPGTVSVEREGSTITVLTADADIERARDGVAALERAVLRLLPAPAAATAAAAGAAGPAVPGRHTPEEGPCS